MPNRQAVHRRPRRRWIVAAALCGLALAACSRDQPTAPGAGTHRITGHVVLVGYLVDSNSVFLGTKVVGDADGVAVDLLSGNTVVRRTTTVHGVYTFAGVPSGGYTAFARVTDDAEDETAPLVVKDGDVASADTLHLRAVGDMRPVPNPYVDQLTTYFDVPDSSFIELDVLDVKRDTVTTLFRNWFRAGTHAVRWTGHAYNGSPATDPMHWVTYRGPDGTRAQLLFRTPAAAAMNTP